MNTKQFQELVDQLDDKRKALLFKKGHDYGTSTDRLSNFKRMSQLCRLLGLAPESSPRDCALFLALLKIDRWQNLSRQGIGPANESVEDTVLDLLNYINLAYACMTEEKDKTSSKTYSIPSVQVDEDTLIYLSSTELNSQLRFS